MAKKKHEHGELYLHAKRELELAGLSTPKGQNDTAMYSTTLRLIDTLERGTKTEFQRNVVIEFFGALARHVEIGSITDNPEDWEPAEGIAEGLMVNKRNKVYFSRDKGISWVNSADNTSGISDHYEAPPEKEESDASTETKEDV